MKVVRGAFGVITRRVSILIYLEVKNEENNLMKELQISGSFNPNLSGSKK